MHCPKCGAKGACIDSRENTIGATRRRYQCQRNKKHRWTTLEMMTHFGDRNGIGYRISDIVKKRFQDEGREQLKKDFLALLSANQEIS